MFKEQKPHAIALSGGGSKGAYTVGILKYLVENDFSNFKIIYGTSTGALISCLFGLYSITKDKKYFNLLEDIYTSVSNKDILKPNHKLAYTLGKETGTLIASFLFGGKSIYDTQPLESLIDKHMKEKDWDTLINANKEFEIGFCCYNMQKAHSEIITNITHPDRNILRKAVLASSNQPIFMPPVNIFENCSDQYYDGGIKDYNPIEKIFESKLFNSIEQIITISTDLPKIKEQNSQLIDIASIFTRTTQLLVLGVMDTDLKISLLYNVLLKLKEYLSESEYVEFIKTLPNDLQTFIFENLQDKKYCEILNIYPEKDIELDSLSFDSNKMAEVLNLGYNHAKDIFKI